MHDLQTETCNPYPDETPVLVWYPPREADVHDRNAWSWLPGTIVSRADVDEWCVVVEVEDVGEPDPDDPDELLYPLCFRDASELRLITEEQWTETYKALRHG